MNAIETACNIIGSQRALAASLLVSAPTVNQWCSGERPIPVDRCPAIEHACRAEVRCEDLRPDIRWVRIPDAAWPHPAGRPLVDHSIKLGVGDTAPAVKEAA